MSAVFPPTGPSEKSLPFLSLMVGLADPTPLSHDDSLIGQPPSVVDKSSPRSSPNLRPVGAIHITEAKQPAIILARPFVRNISDETGSELVRLWKGLMSMFLRLYLVCMLLYTLSVLLLCVHSSCVQPTFSVPCQFMPIFATITLPTISLGH